MQQNTRPLVRIENVWKSRGENVVLKGVSMVVDKGEVMCLLGASGAGKSTLLRCINAIEPADRGLIHVDDVLIGCTCVGDHYRRLRERDVSAQRADIGMVFQGFNLFPHMSVMRNITEGPIRVRGMSKAEAQDLARELLQRVGLADKAEAYPRHLSGGQQQRVAIARALAMKPKLMLYDEPTSALDPEMIREVLDVMAELSADGMTSVCVTHEMGFARRAADRIIFMEEGAIIENSLSEVFFNGDVSPRAQQFLNQILH